MMHYLDEGDGDEAIVFVHGNPTWSFAFRNLVNDFSSNYRCIAPDHLGCGLSSKYVDEEFRLEDRIEHLSQLLEHLNLKKYHLVVHDWGGAIGLGHAIKNPEKVQSLVILNTAAFTSSVISKRINFLRKNPLRRFLIQDCNVFLRGFYLFATEKGLSRNALQGFAHPFKEKADRKAISDFVGDIPMEPGHPSYSSLDIIEKQLKSLNCPKLIMWGGKDFCFHEHFYNKWRDVFPEAKTQFLPHAGHLLLEDDLETCLKSLKHFYGANHEPRSLSSATCSAEPL